MKRLTNVLTADKVIRDPLKQFKVDVHFRILDSLNAQLEDRFSDQSLAIMTQTDHFSNDSIQKTTISLQPNMIRELCDFYNLGSEETAAELLKTLVSYTNRHTLI